MGKKKSNKAKTAVPSLMTDYVGMGCKVDLLGRVAVRKKGK